MSIFLSLSFSFIDCPPAKSLLPPCNNLPSRSYTENMCNMPLDNGYVGDHQMMINMMSTDHFNSSGVYSQYSSQGYSPPNLDYYSNCVVCSAIFSWETAFHIFILWEYCHPVCTGYNICMITDRHFDAYREVHATRKTDFFSILFCLLFAPRFQTPHQTPSICRARWTAIRIRLPTPTHPPPRPRVTARRRRWTLAAVSCQIITTRIVISSSATACRRCQAHRNPWLN